MKRLTAVLLTLGIILAIVADSADFFFHRPYYEYWDLAANSLCVNRAKHFAELYGSYSRWGFHHPGPVFFYVQALGEWVFYDLLHLTPTPFNAQTLANLCLTTSLFVAALASFSRWLTESARRLFIPAALVVAAVHFGAVARMPSYDMLLGSTPFTSAWTAHSWVFPFLCLLTAAASVMAGRGRDLPLLALAAGLLVHAHIAAPLFVGPVALLAYAGLLTACVSRERGAAGGIASSSPVWSRVRWALGAAWRAFPRFHLVALVILTVFALPIVIDLFLGDESNIHAVLTHLRLHQGEHKSLMRSIFYFVQFGAYRPYKAHVHAFKRFDAAGAYAYLWYHKKIYAAWIGGVLLVIWFSALHPLLLALRRRRQNLSVQAPTDSVTAPAASEPTRLLVCAGVFLALSIVLTFKWGTIQDGEMFYYSGWINFAIYYFGLMIVLAGFSSVLSLRLDQWKQTHSSGGRSWVWIERLIPVAAVALACYLEAARFRVVDPTPQVTRALHESNLRIVQDANARNPKGIKILNMPFLSWPIVTGLALEMERQKQPYMVVGVFTACFPRSDNWRPTSLAEQELMEVWHFKLGKLYKLLVSGVPKWWISRGETLERQMAAAQRPPAPDQPIIYPLLNDVELQVDVPKLDPNTTDHATVDFRKHATTLQDEHYGFYKHPKFALILKQIGTSSGCALYGFSDPESWGTWNDGAAGILRMRGEIVPDSSDVEIHLDAHPFLAPDAKLFSQRMDVSVNGTLLGPEKTLFEDGDVVYTVPGALWNKTFGQDAGAAIEFLFPDAASPARIESNNEKDGRLLGVGFREITVRAVPAEHDQPSLELGAVGKPVELDFKPGGNAGTFAGEGWYAPESWGTWSSGHASELHFHSRPVEGTREVEITLDIHAVMDTDSAIKGQRVRATLGDAAVDREHVVEGAGSLVLRVSSAAWNAAVADNAEAVLQLEFPDAVSPARLDPTGKEQDERLLALGIKRISFCNVPAPVVTAR